MSSSGPGGPNTGPGGSGEERNNTPPVTREQIELYLSTLKSMIVEHNRRENVTPIRLDFEDDKPTGNERVVKKNEGIATEVKVAKKDLGKPFKEMSRSPLSRRILEFSAPEHKMPYHIKLYDGSTDPEDHLTRFTGAAMHGEWPMPVWCRMFQQTV